MAGVSTLGIHLAAKPPRLTRNRHGTYTFRWMVPVHLRARLHVRREIKVSLRTTDDIQARILALELNLELERLRATMPQDPADIRHLINPMILKPGGGVEADIRTDSDLRLFQDLLSQNYELREGLMQRIRRGEDPGQAASVAPSQQREELPRRRVRPEGRNSDKRSIGCPGDHRGLWSRARHAATRGRA